MKSKSPMKSRLVFFLVPLLLDSTGVAAATTLAQVGPHHPLFTFEKNENPQNIMVFYTKVDDKCRILTDPTSHQPLFDSYWLMNKTTYKPVHSMIKSGMQERLQLIPSVNSNSFFVKVNDLKEVETDIPDPRLEITAKPVKDQNCAVGSFIKLGPSNKNAKIHLNTLYSETEKTVMPPFRRLISITLSGTDVKTGESISRKYSVKK
jgi:hypothetical protein